MFLAPRTFTMKLFSFPRVRGDVPAVTGDVPFL